MGEFPESLTQNFRDFRVVRRTIMMSKKIDLPQGHAKDSVR